MAPNDEPFILIVEDDPDQAALIQAAFKTSLAQAKTHFVFNGLEAQAYLARESPYHDWERCPTPSLIVLDLRQPDSNGFEGLEWMAEWEWLAKIPVIVFTSEDPEHERRAHGLGVRRYIRKPVDYGELVVAVQEELGLLAVVNTTLAVTSRGAQETEDLWVEPRKVKRLTGLALFSLSLFGMTLIVVAYEVMRYASTAGVVLVPLYVMATSYIAISALVVVYFVTGAQRRRRAVETENEGLIVALQRSLAEGDYIKEAASNDSAEEEVPAGKEPGPIEVQGVIPWIADAETWNFTYVGPEAENLLGYPIRDWYKKGFWAEHIHDADRDLAIKYCERMSRTCEAYVFDYRMTKKGGGFIWLRDFVRVDSLDGVPVTLRGFMFDISDLDEDEVRGGHPPHKKDPDDGGSDKEPHWAK